jgi:hypothetical protein
MFKLPLVDIQKIQILDLEIMLDITFDICWISRVIS